jgi:hypothetical protein
MSQSDSGISPADLLSVLEVAFRSGLQEIKRIRSAQEPVPLNPRPRAKRKDASTSRTGNAVELLTQANRPLHILEILEALDERGLPATRDSLASALTKLVAAPNGPIVRVAPNTFTVKGR